MQLTQAAESKPNRVSAQVVFLPPGANDPAVLAENSDETAQVLNALKSLNPDQQAVLELTALGWSCQEIGQIVGCPSNTVKTRMFNARKKLFAQRDAEQSSQKSEA